MIWLTVDHDLLFTILLLTMNLLLTMMYCWAWCTVEHDLLLTMIYCWAWFTVDFECIVDHGYFYYLWTIIFFSGRRAVDASMSDPYMLVQFDDGGFLLSGVNPRSNALSSRVMDVRSALMSTGAPRYVKSVLVYMLVVLVVYLPVPTTLWKYLLGSRWLLNVYEHVFAYFYLMCTYKDE